MSKELLQKFSTDPDFHLVMDWARDTYRPKPAQYSPAETSEEEERQIRFWKANSLKAEGFDILFKVLTGR